MRRWRARLLAIEIVGKHEHALQQHPHNAIAVVSITPDLCHHLSSLLVKRRSSTRQIISRVKPTFEKT